MGTIDPRDEPYVPTTHTAPEHEHHDQLEQQPPAAAAVATTSSMSGDSIGNFVFFGLALAFLGWFVGMCLLGPDATSNLSKHISSTTSAIASGARFGSKKAMALGGRGGLHRSASGDAYHLA